MEKGTKGEIDVCLRERQRGRKRKIEVASESIGGEVKRE